jgi:hypothetical protein
MRRHEAEYVLPLRWQTLDAADPDVHELTGYLCRLRELVDVTVIDGSAAPAFAMHHRAWGSLVRHVPPQPWPGRNGKVAGVVTGVRRARHERVVIADDDVRYDPTALAAVLDALADADLVRPQNYFDPLPWHARWDTGRSLLNRALGHDHPGTFGIRRSTFVAMGGYDGDALFENLELARTVAASGGVERHLPDVFVRRLPPSAGHFRGQRVRQAYDDLAQPVRLAVELALLPAAVAMVLARPRWLLVAAGTVVVLAELGRRRAGGTRVFARTAAWWALPWLTERGVCVWLALGHRLLGGVPYRGTRVPRAANSLTELRRGRSRSPQSLTPG